MSRTGTTPSPMSASPTPLSRSRSPSLSPSTTPAPAAMGSAMGERVTTVEVDAVVEPPPIDDNRLRLHSLHLLLFDIRLTALSARLANDRSLQTLLYRLPPLVLIDLLSQMQVAREQDIAASPRSILPTEDAATAAFRSARRALKIEFRLNEILDGYHSDLASGALGLGPTEDDPNTGMSLPKSTLELFTSIIHTSFAHRKSHVNALGRAFESWADSDSSINLRANIEALQARLSVLKSDTKPMPSSRSDSNSPTSQHQLHSHPTDIDANPFDPPGYASGTAPLFKSYSSSTLRAPAHHADSAANSSNANRSTASLSAAAGYEATHPYGAPWPPSPHYYYLPPYGHPHGAFPPLYDSTPLHFPLTDRLLRDTPSRVAGFHPGSASASNPSLRPHMTSPSAFEVGDTSLVAGPKAAAARPTSVHSKKVMVRGKPSEALVDGPGPNYEVTTGKNGRPVLRKKVSKGGKKVASRLAHLAQSEGAGMLAAAIVQNAPVPKNVKRWHSIGRVVNDWYGFEEHGPSKAELLSKGMGIVLKNARRSHSFHGGTRGLGEDSDSDSEEGNTIGRIASHAIGMVAGGNKGKKGNPWGNMASEAINSFSKGKKGGKRQLRRTNSWSDVRGGGGPYDRSGGDHGAHFEDGRYERRGGRQANFADERRNMMGRNMGGGGRNRYSDDEDDGLPGLVSHAMEALMANQRRSGRGKSGGVMSQIGGLVGRGGNDRRSRGGGGPADAVEMAFKVLNKLR